MTEHSCTRCKLRAKYDRDPHSILGRLWRWHIRFCPGWRAYMKSLPSGEKVVIRQRYSLPAS